MKGNIALLVFGFLLAKIVLAIPTPMNPNDSNGASLSCQRCETVTKRIVTEILIKRAPKGSGRFDGYQTTSKGTRYIWDAQQSRWWRYSDRPQRFRGGIDFQGQKERDNPRSSKYRPPTNKENRAAKAAQEKARKAEVDRVNREAATYAENTVNDEDHARVNAGYPAYTSSDRRNRKRELAQAYREQYLLQVGNPSVSPSPPPAGPSQRDPSRSPTPPT